MGFLASLRGMFVATWSGVKHLFKPRMTLRYPEQKLDLEGPGYQYDAKKGVGLPGFKGRHILFENKCTGCQLCAIACDGVAVAIDMQLLNMKKPQNKKDIWPAVDYGRCVPPSTPITTHDGIKPISDVHVGDRVLTHTGKFNRVTQLFRRNYTGKLYTFWTLGSIEPLTTTEDHPILVYDDENGQSWLYANQVSYRTLFTRPILSEPIPGAEPKSSYELYDQTSGGAGTAATISYVRLRDNMVVSPVVRIEVTEVKDYLVQNLEVEGDNSYVAANVSVHNCVFCALCIAPETQVATNPGFKRIDQIAVGDVVLTHSGHYKPVTRLWDMTYTGALYKIRVLGKPEPLICTADHPILAVSRPRSRKKDKRLLRVTEPLKFFKPGELKKGDYLVAPIVKKEVPIETYEKTVSLYRFGLVKRKLVLSAGPDLFRLIGYYLAEGCCAGGRTNFDFSVAEKGTLVADCSELLKRFFGKAPVLRRNGVNGLRLTLNSAIAEDFFAQFGEGAPNKHIPDWAFFAERTKVLQLLKGEWLGDGCSVRQPRQRYVNITTTSEVLAFQLQQLYAKVGVVATVDTIHQKDRLPAHHVNVFGRWAQLVADLWNVNLDWSPTKHADKFHISQNYVYMPIKSIEVSEVKDYRVMDVTVEGDHTFAPLGLATSNCVDACPFDALYMTNDYELSAYDRASLKFTPEMLMVPPKIIDQTTKVKIDPERGTATHG